MIDEIDVDEDDPTAWALLRYQELYREFAVRHPAQLRANKFVDDRFQESRIRGYSTRLDREAERIGDDLFVSYNQLSDIFCAAPVEIREHLFRLLMRVMVACHGLGQHDAPEGRSARDAHSEKASSKGHAVEIAVRIYLEAHPDPRGRLPKATSEFAKAIRPDILDALSLPQTAKRPAVSAIKQAIGAVKRVL